MSVSEDLISALALHAEVSKGYLRPAHLLRLRLPLYAANQTKTFLNNCDITRLGTGLKHVEYMLENWRICWGYFDISFIRGTALYK